ncbi:hypothetical protein JHW43_008905 [Diplocarpon mali]|nr:hypothetical protein JHW43_008905 [Diplocarpon mali]
MDALSRHEYPAILARLTPRGVSAKLNERVKRIGKVNSEIADWLQERRKVEETYIAGLRKLSNRPLAEVGQDLGVFDTAWKKIISSTEEIAKSHSHLAERINNDIELSLRNYAIHNKEMSTMPNLQGNLAGMAKELEDAQSKSDKLNLKGGKASAQKVEAATTRLQAASSQWDSQAPFILETLQSIDESRLNHLRDILTQYETLEMDNLNRCQKNAESALGLLVEVDTSIEIQHWSQAAVAGRPLIERRSTRQSSMAGSTSAGHVHIPPPAAPASTHTDDQSEHSGKQEQESKLMSRFGTMLGRRRQSIHGGFARAPSPTKGFMPFSGRNTASRDGRPSPSPKVSTNNLRETLTDNRLSSLAESPQHSPTSQINGNLDGPSSNAPNGSTSSNLPDISNIHPPPGSPPAHAKESVERDSEGFSVPAPMNNPISQALQDAASESEQQQYKLDIRPEPIPEQDADAQAALTNVANTLKSATTPNRKAGTVRGRRDVRNTVFAPSSSLDVASPDTHHPPSPILAPGRAAALAALSENATAPSVSDTTSIRSGHSLTNNAMVKHGEIHEPGLHSSIIEIVSVIFEDGAAKSSKVSGEIALSYNKEPDDNSSSSKFGYHEERRHANRFKANATIRINNFPNMEAIAENRTFIHSISEEKPDEFTLDLKHISSKPSVAFTYRVHIDEANISSQGPLLLKLSWKKQGDKLGAVIEYGLNPAFSSTPVKLNNLTLVTFYTGARATGCQTRPSGTHQKEKSYIYWRLGDVTLTQDQHKVVCRLTGTEGAMPEPGHAEAKWEINKHSDSPLDSGISLSKLDPSKGKGKEENDDPFADESMVTPAFVDPAGTWSQLSIRKKLISGKYQAR